MWGKKDKFCTKHEYYNCGQFLKKKMKIGGRRKQDTNFNLLRENKYKFRIACLVKKKYLLTMMIKQFQKKNRE